MLWYVYYVKYLVVGVSLHDLIYQQRKKVFSDPKHYYHVQGVSNRYEKSFITRKEEIRFVKYIITTCNLPCSASLQSQGHQLRQSNYPSIGSLQSLRHMFYG